MVRGLYWATIVVSCAFLSGCVTTGADGVEVRQIHKQAVTGERTRVNHATLVRSDCSVRSVPNIRVTEPPKHGYIDVVEEEVLPASLKGDLARCRTTPVRGAVVYYTSVPGYTGKDEFRTRDSNSIGGVRDYFAEIDVVK